MESGSFKVSYVPPPTYLSYFDIGNKVIKLVQSKKNVVDVITPEKNNESLTNNTLMNLTGSPLKVNLSSDDSLNLSKEPIMLNLWSEEESNHSPLDLQNARDYINQQYRTKKDEQDYYVVICDGKNSEKTLVLMSQKSGNNFMTGKVNVMQTVPVCKKEDELLVDLMRLEEQHRLNVRMENCKVSYQTVYKYYLYGTLLHDSPNLNNLDFNGSICFNMVQKDKGNLNFVPITTQIYNLVWFSFCFKNNCPICSNWRAGYPELTKARIVTVVSKTSSNAESTLQVITGHPSSPVQFLWQNLCNLQFYLNVLNDPSKCNNPETILFDDGLNSCDIEHQINVILNSSYVKQESQTEFDLDNIRRATFLDKLFKILKECKTLESLRDAFHYFFEQLVKTEMLIMIMDDTFMIAKIITGIMKGELAVPTLKFSQALDFLLQLGCENLKNDYQAILKHFYSLSSNAIASQWSKFETALELKDSKEKARQTMHFQNLKLNSNPIISYLGNLHVATEFIYLLKSECVMPNFHRLCEEIYNNYLDKVPTTNEFSVLKNSPLQTFTMKLNYPLQDIIKKCRLSYWSLKMISTCYGNIQVTTQFCLSEKPIFPTSVYDQHEINSDLPYYAYKMEMVKRV